MISCPTIHHLRIQGVSFNMTGVEHIARGFLSLYGRLKEFSMRGCAINDESALIIAECIRRSSSTRSPDSINLSDNRITAVGLEALLASLQNIERLNLSANPLGIAGAALLGKFLEANTTLKVLHIEQVNLGSGGIELVMRGLEKNKTLLELHCGENGIDHRVR